MARDLQADVDIIEKASICWRTEAAPELREASAAIENLRFTAVQFGPLFIAAWEAYSKAAVYLQDRLNEGAMVAEDIGNALHSAAVSFADQEFQNQQQLANVVNASDVNLP